MLNGKRYRMDLARDEAVGKVLTLALVILYGGVMYMLYNVVGR